MFNITLHLEPAEATILEVFLRRQGKQDIRRGQIFINEGVFAQRAAVFLEVADQIHQQRWVNIGHQCEEILADTETFPDAPPITYTQVLNGLIKELSGRTVESEVDGYWSRVLHSAADQLDKLHQGGE